MNNSGHSDPDKLKESAEDVQRMSPHDIKKRQMEIKVCRIFFFLCVRFFLHTMILIL